MRRTLGLAWIILVAGFATGGELWADRLVLKDGTELTTRGDWEVKGRLVVFLQSDGTLASIRASEIDFDKSTAATQEASTPPPPPPPPPKKASVMSLTEKDLPPVGDGPDATTAPGAPGTPGAAAPALIVLPSWRTVVAPDGQSTELLGVVRNDSRQAALGVQVVAVLISSEGEIMAEIEGASSERALQPGQSTSFRVGFENGQAYERIEFRVNGSFAAEPPSAAKDQGVAAENPDGI